MSDEEKFKATHHIARWKYERAVRMVAQAEALLDAACRELSPICWAIYEYEKIGRHADDIKELRRQVAYSAARDKVYVDNYYVETAIKEYEAATTPKENRPESRKE